MVCRSVVAENTYLFDCIIWNMNAILLNTQYTLSLSVTYIFQISSNMQSVFMGCFLVIKKPMTSNPKFSRQLFPGLKAYATSTNNPDIIYVTLCIYSWKIKMRGRAILVKNVKIDKQIGITDQLKKTLK